MAITEDLVLKQQVERALKQLFTEEEWQNLWIKSRLFAQLVPDSN